MSHLSADAQHIPQAHATCTPFQHTPTHLAVPQREGRPVFQQVRRLRLHALQDHVHAPRPPPVQRQPQDGNPCTRAATGAGRGGCSCWACREVRCIAAAAALLAAAFRLVLWRGHWDHHMQLRLHPVANGDRPAPQRLLVCCRAGAAASSRHAAEGERVVGQIGSQGQWHCCRAGGEVEQASLLLLLPEGGGCGGRKGVRGGEKGGVRRQGALQGLLLPN